MTALATTDDRERCLAAGMNDYVTKPVEPKLLAEALERWLPKEAAGLSLVHLAAPGAPRASSELDDLAVFDYPSLRYRLMDDDELIRSVAEGFLADLPVQVARLEEILARGDAAAVREQAHKIKGATANIGGDLASAIAAEIEKDAVRGEIRPAAARFAALERAVERLGREIEAMIPPAAKG